MIPVRKSFLVSEDVVLVHIIAHIDLLSFKDYLRSG